MSEEPTGNQPSEDAAEPEPRFDQDQYDMLMRCSQTKDITEWNEWRGMHPVLPVLLEGADLKEAHLEKANLARAHLEKASLDRAHLEGVNFYHAHLQKASFHQAYLEGAEFGPAHLEGAFLFESDLEAADLHGTHLEGASLYGAYLTGATLSNSHLEGAHLGDASLQGAILREAHLEGANLSHAHLEGVSGRVAVVDGETLLEDCSIDMATDFTGVGLDEARVDPGLKQLLEYNVRRIRWSKWYGEGLRRYPRARRWYRKILRWRHGWRWLMWPFWWMSDYGRSMGRIIATFFILAAAFAAAYAIWPGMLAGLATEGTPLFLRSVYFSVVTMTTLGFGDITANPTRPAGHILLMFQVILGYVLLGALVTRFAVLFTAGGPASNHLMKTTWSMSERVAQILQARDERRLAAIMERASGRENQAQGQ